MKKENGLRITILGCMALLLALAAVGVASGQAGNPVATETVVRPDWLDPIGTGNFRRVADPDGYPWLQLRVRGEDMVFAWPSGNPYWQEYAPLPLNQAPSSPRAYVSSYPGYPGVYLITQFAFYRIEQGQRHLVYDRVGLVATDSTQDGAYPLVSLDIPAKKGSD